MLHLFFKKSHGLESWSHKTFEASVLISVLECSVSATKPWQPKRFENFLWNDLFELEFNSIVWEYGDYDVQNKAETARVQWKLHLNLISTYNDLWKIILCYLELIN